MSDAGNNPVGSADGNTSGDDYAHWPDGSLKKDLNRGIVQIDYNLLKLLRAVRFNSGKVVSYQYDAGGRKLRTSSSTGEVRDYSSQAEYVNGVFSLQRTPEGQVYNRGGSGVDPYEYFVVDHLGNLRATYGDSLGVATLSQRMDYDPWGLELAGIGYQRSGNPNRLRFNGKEAISELGSGLLDFGARLYDAQIGRLHQVDALADAFAGVSPFSFGLNNPIFNIDPSGDSTVPAQPSQVTMGSPNVGQREVQSNAAKVSTGRMDGGNTRTYEEPIKGGGFPKGEIRSTIEQHAVLRSADGLNYTDIEKASQLGVNIFWLVEGGFSLMKLGQWFKSLAGLGKSVQELTLVTERGTNAFNHSFKYADRVRVRAVQDPVSHNFPYSFDDAVLSTKAILKDNGYKIFQQSGTMKGKKGVFEIGLTKDGIIDHRFFRPIK